MAKKNLSIKEIAEISGVSVATVSRVINQNGRFSKETEEKVLNVIKENNYKTNLIAKSLRVRQTNTIGIIVPDIKNEFFATIVSEIEEYFFEKENFTVFICNTNSDKEKELDYLASLDAKGVDGLIYISGYDDTLYTSVRRDIPIVCIDRKPKKSKDIVIVESDNFDGGFKATNFLLEGGCKNIVVVKGEQEISTSVDRFNGYVEALKMKNVELDEKLIINLKKTHFSESRKAIQHLINSNISFDGIFALNDWLALGALYALKDNNINVPKDVKIIGFDNVSIGKYSYPSITTVNQDKRKMGYVAAEKLVKLMRKSLKDNHIILPVSIINRETT
ncbi:LacI family DNA-binding transcriptional regulator [Staphylococcus simiae]|uniref:Transcriptional regulator, LacI family protein n=1 Tax=Staphylococcus simiae CCM 7213 = CCUG 51256 TaxID=911238 RepID=G5JJQ9_9STAP|nr:LacI family DNA-binding transcriptional regulator [Staphylococcus simiae]EHJ07566.1 transcriptional regulator, LacI family protein [Staphylococcus simiae CCM 7213 = CCUG 51256]PNZ14688.1 LacI family transcriptional regulator [Staphylococcus simiae]SNV55239.1 transcriptional repressor of ribose operon [Staphylococcus simiae]